MTKILKAVMFTRLFDKFPQITKISKNKHTHQLTIFSWSPTLQEGTIDAHNVSILVIVDPANIHDKAEPYTQETLDLALDIFPREYDSQAMELKGRKY
jgi:hypothetical protein